MSTRLVLVRHGQTEAAVAGRSQGRIDNPLNAQGRRQAEALCARLLEYAPAAIYSSPLVRAVASVEPLAAALGLRVQIEPRLSEMDYGGRDDLTGVEMREREPGFMAAWSGADPSDLRMPDGETLREVQARLVAAVEDLVAAHPDQTLVVCSHNFALRTLICHCLGLPLEAFRSLRVDLASYSVVEWSAGGLLVTLLNEVCQLPG